MAMESSRFLPCKTGSKRPVITYLPEELIFKILSSCTCGTTLLRCKSVCKLWLSIISNPEFINAQYVNSLEQIPSMMMITSRKDDTEGRCSATIVYSNSFEDSVNIPLMKPLHNLEFVSSCHGVVCVFDDVRRQVYLFNPLTRMSKKLPLPPVATSPRMPRQPPPLPPRYPPPLRFPPPPPLHLCFRPPLPPRFPLPLRFPPPPPLHLCFRPPPPPPLALHPPPIFYDVNSRIFSAIINPQPPFRVDVALGFDFVSHDFKVLWIEYQSSYTSMFVDVAAVKLYSSNSDSWREIKVGIALPSFLCSSFCPVLRSGPVVDGVLYLEGANAVVTFDLHSELFGLISYPFFIYARTSSILNFEGSVAVVGKSFRNGLVDEKELSLWTLVAVSGGEVVWNKMFTFEIGVDKIEWILLYPGANQFFVRTKSGDMLYDYKKKETKYVELPSKGFVVRVLNHTESLLPVEGFEGAKES